MIPVGVIVGQIAAAFGSETVKKILLWGLVALIGVSVTGFIGAFFYYKHQATKNYNLYIVEHHKLEEVKRLHSEEIKRRKSFDRAVYLSNLEKKKYENELSTKNITPMFVTRSLAAHNNNYQKRDKPVLCKLLGIGCIDANLPQLNLRPVVFIAPDNKDAAICLDKTNSKNLLANEFNKAEHNLLIENSAIR